MPDYIKRRELGSGGFGEVWSCIRENESKEYAVKTLIDISDNSVRRFVKEVNILSKLESL